MGVNNPYLPTSVRSDEEAIQYLSMMVNAMKSQTYVPLTGAGPFTLTAVQTVGTAVDLSGSATAVVLNTPTAAAIIAQMQALDSNAAVGSTAYLNVINDNTASGVVTLTAGDGNVTFVGGAAVQIATARRYLITWATATTVTFTRV